MLVSTFGMRAEGNLAPSDATTVPTVVASLHSFPVASMPPFAPPEQSRACAGIEISATNTNGMRRFVFMSEPPFQLANEPSPDP